MYTRRERQKKEAIQAKVNEWIYNLAQDTPELTQGDCVTLSGSNPHNAIKSVRGLYNGKLFMYETNRKVWKSAKNQLYYHGQPLNTLLSVKDIHNTIHENCTCFYYDFCCSFKNVNFTKIYEEIDTQTQKGQSFSIVFTLGLRGQYNVNKCTTQETMDKFKEEMSWGYPDYRIKTMTPITYCGGPNGKGAPMYVWAAAFIKDKPMVKRNLRQKHPDLFKQSGGATTNYLPQEEKQMKHKKQTAKGKDDVDMDAIKKEMVRVLVGRKKRNYTNKQIAEIMDMSTQSVAAMAAWNHPNLKAKRK